MKNEEGFLGIIESTLLRLFVLLIAVWGCITYLSRIPEIYIYRRPVTQTIQQLTANPRRGWFRVPSCVLDLTAAGYTYKKDGGAFLIDAPGYASRSRLGVEPHLIIRTSNFADLETIDHLRLMTAHGNERNIPRWAAEHPDQAWPRRDVFGMIRSVPINTNNKGPGDTSTTLTLEEGERPDFWSIILFGLGGFAASYWIIRNWVRLWLRDQERDLQINYIPPSVGDVNTSPRLLGIHPGPAGTGRLVPGKTINVPEGRWATVFLYGRSYDGLPPGEHRLDPATLPKLADAIHEEQGEDLSADAVLLTAPFGPLEMNWQGKWKRNSAEYGSIETATIQGLVDLDVKDGQAFAHLLLLYLAGRLRKDAMLAAKLPQRWGGDPSVDAAIRHLLRGGPDYFGEAIADYVSAAEAPDEERGVIATTSEGITMRAKAMLQRSLSGHGVDVLDLTYLEPASFEIEPCQACGALKKLMRPVRLTWFCGFLFDTWELERDGNHCRTCGVRRACAYSLLTLLTGVWGIWSLFLGAVTMYFNALSAFRLLTGKPAAHRIARR